MTITSPSTRTYWIIQAEIQTLVHSEALHIARVLYVSPLEYSLKSFSIQRQSGLMRLMRVAQSGAETVPPREKTAVPNGNLAVRVNDDPRRFIISLETLRNVADFRPRCRHASSERSPYE